jgi:dipeptidyl aminopeptidase/acylaminoacyl peptidase
MYTPKEMDGKKYPVIFYIFPWPQSGSDSYYIMHRP